MNDLSKIKAALTDPAARWFERDDTHAIACLSFLIIPCILALALYNLGYIANGALVATAIMSIATSLSTLVLTSSILTKQQLRAQKTIEERLMVMDATFLVACHRSPEFTKDQQALITQTLNKYHPGWSLA